jgi:hypothetical protein
MEFVHPQTKLVESSDMRHIGIICHVLIPLINTCSVLTPPKAQPGNSAESDYQNDGSASN